MPSIIEKLMKRRSLMEAEAEHKTVLDQLDQIRNSLSEIATREEELRAALEETGAETTTEEWNTLEAEAEQVKQEREAKEAELAEAEQTAQELEKKIHELEAEDLEQPAPDSEEKTEESPTEEREERNHMQKMITRGVFRGMTEQNRDLILRDSETESFIRDVRELKTRAGVTNAELSIPTQLVAVLQSNTERYSKLMQYVRVVNFKGDARVAILAKYPEGIWTESVDAVKELTLNVNYLTLSGFKVGGYISMPVSTLEDSDLQLAEFIIDALAQSIGKAIDRAILYGTGKGQPVGIVTRLTATEAVRTATPGEEAFENISTTNGAVKLDPEHILKSLIGAAGLLDAPSTDGLFWAMNRQTYQKVLQDAYIFTGNGTYVANVGSTMPVLGGDIVVLDIVGDDDIIGGYGSNYILCNRHQYKLAQSTDVRFIEDQVVYKATQRLDGAPAIAKAFVACDIKGGAVEKTGKAK